MVSRRCTNNKARVICNYHLRGHASVDHCNYILTLFPWPHQSGQPIALQLAIGQNEILKHRYHSLLADGFKTINMPCFWGPPTTLWQEGVYPAHIRSNKDSAQ